MITPIYAALCGLIFVFLSFRVIKRRQAKKIALGDGQDDVLMRAIRVHGNFAEYIPLALVLLFLLETQTSHTLLIHGLGTALVLGRLLHSYGVSQANEVLRLRVFGMVMTFLVIIATSIRILFSYF